MIFCGDFETIRRDDRMYVWLWDLCEISGDYNHITGTNIHEFFNYLYSLDDEPIVYFHNFKFDGTYILNYLNDNGYKYVEKGCNPLTYNILVTDRGVWFCGSCTNKDGKTIIFRDSLKKIPLKVANIPKAYGLEESKGEIDYTMERPEGYIPTDDELEYVKHDTEIVAKALKQHFDAGMTALTAPADAMEDYKNKVNFNSLFVPNFWFTHKSVETFCRKAYCGGISWVNPDIQEKEVRHGLVYDYNSMYPSVMTMYPFPYGYPIRFYNEPPKDTLYIARCKVNISRKPGKLACIRNPTTRTWIEDEYEGELYLTNIDIENLVACYNSEEGFIEILDGYYFKSKLGLFDCYINYWKEIKLNSKGGKRQIAKLMQNSFYGKFGTNPERAHKIPIFEDGILMWKQSETSEGKVFNVAVACFVTAYARRELRYGVEHSQGFCYCDTDSVHLASINGKAAKFTGKVDDVQYGCWKLENRFVRARYLRQKTYIEEKSNGKLLIAACGCPDSSKNYITYDNFKMGASYKGKLMPVMRKGGAELVEKKFTVRVPIQRF